MAHGNMKSSARLLCPPERMLKFRGWGTPYVHDTVTVLSRDSGTTTQGSAFGSRAQIIACLGIGACLRRNAVGDHWR